MVMPAVSPRLWTRAEFDVLPEDGRSYELVDGQLYVNGVEVPGHDLAALRPEMTPGPSWRHQTAVGLLFRLLDRYLEAHRVGDVLFAPLDIEFDVRRVVQPDLLVVPLVGGRAPRSWVEAERLLLAVEILSPTTARFDRTRKRRVYQDAGVPEYWIVDIDARLVERWRPGDERPEIVDERLVWRPDGVGDEGGLAIEIARYFADVIGE